MDKARAGKSDYRSVGSGFDPGYRQFIRFSETLYTVYLPSSWAQRWFLPGKVYVLILHRGNVAWHLHLIGTVQWSSLRSKLTVWEIFPGNRRQVFQVGIQTLLSPDMAIPVSREVVTRRSKHIMQRSAKGLIPGKKNMKHTQYTYMRELARGR